VYLMGLSKAYKLADLTLVYPLARALPVLIVLIIALVVYGQSLLSVVDMLALGMITIGAVVMPIKRWRTWHMNMYLNAGVGWVFLAAIGTAGYSFIDSVALQNMHAARWQPFTAGSTFVALQSSSIVFWMIPILRWGLREPIEIPQKIPKVLVTETFSVGTYLLVLISMSLVEEVNYVVALRQLSIPMGMVRREAINVSNAGYYVNANRFGACHNLKIDEKQSLIIKEAVVDIITQSLMREANFEDEKASDSI